MPPDEPDAPTPAATFRPRWDAESGFWRLPLLALTLTAAAAGAALLLAHLFPPL